MLTQLPLPILHIVFLVVTDTDPSDVSVMLGVPGMRLSWVNASSISNAATSSECLACDSHGSLSPPPCPPMEMLSRSYFYAAIATAVPAPCCKECGTLPSKCCILDRRVEVLLLRNTRWLLAQHNVYPTCAASHKWRWYTTWLWASSTLQRVDQLVAALCRRCSSHSEASPFLIEGMW